VVLIRVPFQSPTRPKGGRPSDFRRPKNTKHRAQNWPKHGGAPRLQPFGRLGPGATRKRVCFLSHQIGSFLGAWLGGFVFDVTGSYSLIWGATAVAGLLAAALHFPIDDTEVITAPVLAAS